MARFTYTYQYQVYPDCPKATSWSRFWCSPKHGAYIGMIVGTLISILGCLIYNARGHNMGVIDTILILGGLFVFFAGGFIIPFLFKKLRISDRIYERETGKKPD